MCVSLWLDFWNGFVVSWGTRMLVKRVESGKGDLLDMQGDVIDERGLWMKIVVRARL